MLRITEAVHCGTFFFFCLVLALASIYTGDYGDYVDDDPLVAMTVLHEHTPRLTQTHFHCFRSALPVCSAHSVHFHSVTHQLEKKKNSCHPRKRDEQPI